MTIHFLVAGNGAKPNGGTRVIYEHARRLAARGHTVELHHFERFAGEPARRIPRQLLRHTAILRESGTPDWIDLDGVTRHYSFRARLPQITPDDRIVATYWKTHDLLDERTLQSRRCFSLIQGIEDWEAPAGRLHAHWRSASTNLVVSRWLQQEVERVCGQAYLVPNAIDAAFWGAADTNTSGGRTVLFGSMASANKRSADVAAALDLLSSRGIAFTALSFGDRHPHEWGMRSPVEHHACLSQEALRDLYRRADIYVAASASEGWGLTLAEATLSGAALIVSDNPGHREFARPGRGAFSFRTGDVERLADKLAFLLDRPALRAALVANARQDLAPFTWDAATDAMERALELA